MILSDRDILEEIENGNIVITPAINEEDLSPCTLDVHLGQFIYQFKKSPPAASIRIRLDHPEIATSLASLCDKIDISTRPYVLLPGQFVLAYTQETIKLCPEIAARLEGRSRNARYGLAIHNTAPIIHPTFDAIITLELCNLGTYELELTMGYAIAQLLFERLGSKPLRSIDSPWQHQKADLKPEKEPQ